ncbi:MAG: hypothetical protein K8S98_07540 [Planctomycetes bacterium]|nr:hypothetical protein [Planctomycetota bacterium]
MNRLHLWIGVLALTCFAVGLAAGLVIQRRLAPHPTRPGQFADYEHLLSETFDLSADRRRYLAQAMDAYARDIDAVRTRYLAKAGADMQRELEQVGLRYADLIRNDVLPASRRQAFDEVSQATLYPTQ